MDASAVIAIVLSVLFIIGALYAGNYGNKVSNKLQDEMKKDKK